MSAAKELELVVHIGRDELDGVAQWIDAGARSQLALRATSLAASVQAASVRTLLPAVMLHVRPHQDGARRAWPNFCDPAADGEF